VVYKIVSQLFILGPLYECV